MAGSSRIIDYLGEGTHAARPVTPTLMAGGIGLYYETDTLKLFMWDVAGAAWVQISAGGTPGTVTEVDTGAGLTGGPITTTGTVSVGTTAITNGMLAGSIAASKLVGTDIATVGTVTSGLWHGTIIDLAHGGTDADLSATGPGVVVQGTSGAAFSVSGMTNGQLLIGNTGSVPSAGTIVGVGISVT